MSVFENKDFNNVVQERLELIQKVYLNDNRPWVIGYSGGKDSTVTTDLILRAISKLPAEQLNKHIFIISSDTLVENPMIENYIVQNIAAINNYGKLNRLPISAHMIRPIPENSFWSVLIGKGYPAPNQKFRWCTDRLKIKPANAFIKKQIDEYGEVVTILGVRSSESSSRSASIEKHRIEGKILKKHSSLLNALVFTPIEDFITDDIWKYLLTLNPNIWNEDNQFLMSLYKDSQDGECPLVVDKDTPSCGNSRFGCWVCTVVQEDKSLKGFIQTAHKNRDKETLNRLIPLVELRNWLKENRNKEELREFKRQDGTIYRVDTKEGAKVGLGAYTFEARKKILKMVLETQKKINIELITLEELKIIQNEWNNRLGDLNNTVNLIYKEIYGQNLFFENQAMIYSPEDIELLETLSLEENIDPEIIKRLLRTEQKYYGFIYKQGLYTEIDKILDEEWIHEDKITDIKFGENL